MNGNLLMLYILGIEADLHHNAIKSSKCDLTTRLRRLLQDQFNNYDKFSLDVSNDFEDVYYVWIVNKRRIQFHIFAFKINGTL